MIVQTLRGQVWLFCMYLACAIDSIARQKNLRPAHVDRSFPTLFISVVTPLVIVFMCLSLLRHTRSDIERGIVLLTAATFTSSTLSALHQFGYIWLSVPHLLPSSFWLIATLLMGYRTDQLLQRRDREATKPPCSTPS